MCDRTLGNLQKAAFGRKPVKSRRSSYRGACHSRHPCENWEDVQVGLSVWGSMSLGHKLVQVEMTFVYSKMPREQALLPVSVCHVNIFTGYSIARSSRFAWEFREFRVPTSNCINVPVPWLYLFTFYFFHNVSHSHLCKSCNVNRTRDVNEVRIDILTYLWQCVCDLLFARLSLRIHKKQSWILRPKVRYNSHRGYGCVV